jgi:hypothetical protein
MSRYFNVVWFTALANDDVLRPDRNLIERREIPTQPVHRQAIWTIGSDVHLEIDVRQSHDRSEILPNRIGGTWIVLVENHDAVGFITESKLNLRADHAVGDDASDLPPGNFKVPAKHRSRDSDRHHGTRLKVPGTADDLEGL